MLLQSPEARLVTLLRQCYRSPRCLTTTRALATSSPRRLRAGRLSYKAGSERSYTTGHTPDNVAVLGGGITGLIAAAMVARRNPNAKVTLYEGSSRLGGWVHSEVVQSSDGPVVFEDGPRSLRPGTSRGHYAMGLAENLGLGGKMVFTSQESAAGLNRFIYYPDRLQRMPSPKDMKLQIAYTMLTNPMFEGMFASMWGEDQVPKRPDSLVDESIAEFVKRRSGGNKKPVENIISAVLHGIYAGDVNQLSARSLMSELWAWEGEYGSLTQGMVRSRRARGGGPPQPYADGAVSQELGERANNASIYTFQNGGMQAFPDALEGVIREQKNAVIKTGTRVSGIKRSEDGKSIQIKTSNNQPAQSYSHVLSTLPAHQLASLVDIPALALVPYVTVMTVSLYYTNPDLVPTPGFGYLIPQSVPFSQNPEFALGVVFDSHATPDIDAGTGTKLTVMLGGHYWDGRSDKELPTPEEGQKMAERVLERHLGIKEKPDVGMTLEKGYTGLELALDGKEELKAKLPHGLVA
ncbi:hypothetical protein V495_06041 [Pseudogymnoascus sp. VKM F-4514 (FW-929)]|nr:hypothetical protein V495_06041 [Pseudogymnoascus sp. VKM F-4514 (FW-929)]